MLKISFLLFLLFFIQFCASCVPSNMSPDTLPQTSATSQIVDSTHETPFQTSVISQAVDPTSTLLPSLTPAPVPTKDVLIVYVAVGFGDGGHSFFANLISSDPTIIVFSDGQMLRISHGWYETTQLSESELCTLLRRLDSALDYSGSVYTSPTPGFGFPEGGFSSYLATPGGSIGFYIVEEDYLAPGYVKPIIIIEQFAEGRDYSPYIATHYAIFLEEVQRLDPSINLSVRNLAWPDTPYRFPPLASLLSGRKAGLVLAEGEFAQEILLYLGSIPTIQVFEMDNRDYVAIVRPLLPYETLDTIQEVPSELPVTIHWDSLPFSCP